MNLSEIKKLAAEYDEANKSKREDTLPRLFALIDQHGTSVVAAASGLAETSIHVYMRNKNQDSRAYPSDYAVTKAEKILNTN